MQIRLVILPERTEELYEQLTKDYLGEDKEFRGFTLIRGRDTQGDIIIGSNLIKDRKEIWKLNLELMDKYKITGTIIDYNK